MVLPTGGWKTGIHNLDEGMDPGQVAELEAAAAVTSLLAYNVYDPADPQYGAVRSTVDPGTAIMSANTAAINAAAADARDNNGVLVIKGTYWTNGEIQVQSHMDGSAGSIQVKDRSLSCAMLIGSRVPGVRIDRKHIIVPEIYQNDMPAGFVGTGVGLEISNANTCHITTTHIRGFMVNMWVSAYGQGNVYNTYYMGHLNNGKINLRAMPQTGGWCHENVYIGGRYSHNSTEGEAVAGVRHISLDSNGIKGPNNNLFVKPSIEGVAAEYHVEVIDGQHNRILHGRWETVTGTPRVRYSGTGAKHNVIDHGYNVESIVYTFENGANANVHTDWRGTRMFTTESNSGQAYTSQGFKIVTTGPSVMVNSVSEINPVLSVLPSGSNWDTPESTYGFHFGLKRVRGKATGDANPRVEWRTDLGQIWFGNGTDAVDVSLRQTAANTLGTGPGDNFYVGGELEVDGALNHDGTTVGFYGATPVTKPSALTPADAGVVNSGDAATDAVINNLRTRLNELETKIRSLGLLA